MSGVVLQASSSPSSRPPFRGLGPCLGDQGQSATDRYSTYTFSIYAPARYERSPCKRSDAYNSPRYQRHDAGLSAILHERFTRRHLSPHARCFPRGIRVDYRRRSGQEDPTGSSASAPIEDSTMGTNSRESPYLPKTGDQPADWQPRRQGRLECD